MIIRTRELPRWNGVMLVGISRGVVGIGHGMQQVSQSKKQISRVKKETFPRTILFLGKDLFWGAKKRGSTGEVDVCCSPQPPEALEDPDV